MRVPALTQDARGRSRWALSFADLCLVLLGFLLLLQAHRGDPAALGAGLRATFGLHPPQMFEEAAAPLFQPGEAILQPAARARFVAVGRRAAAGGQLVHLESIGTDAGGRRFDTWELAAARAAAIARAIEAGGLSQDRIDVSIEGTGPAARGRGQRLRLTLSTKG